MSTRRQIPVRPKKAQRAAVTGKTAPPTKATLADLKPATPQRVALPTARVHARGYHWPLLLEDGEVDVDGVGKEGCDGLLTWFEGIEEAREMPWRKKWIDPEALGDDERGHVLSRRAYEVWVSEIMLQQTRVSTVIPYFKNWISKWPTIQDLAEANPDEVLSAWKGLGYYSRATRLHQGAQEMITKNSKDCPIPSDAEALQQFPGIGKYTAGAISSIAFGEAEPVLDGNVARVLSRQLGLYVDVKDKKATDLLWLVADGLVKHVAGFPETQKSAVSGQWNQALMELGSTVCTPRPKCDECPIQKTCKAYAEGDALLNKEKTDAVVPDIEDACHLCEQLDTEDLMVAPEEEEDEDSKKAVKKRKQDSKAVSKKISHYFASSTPKVESNVETQDDSENIQVTGTGTKKRKALQSNAGSKYRATYCSLFPKKTPKKKVAEEECVVCIIELEARDGNSRWLIEQRPAKGLLASLWQFPQGTISASSSASSRKTAAKKFMSGLDAKHIDISNAQHITELNSLVHVFSHLKLTMHVHLFRISVDMETSAAAVPDASTAPPTRKWVATEAMDAETLSTGMRRCWDLVKAC